MKNEQLLLAISDMMDQKLQPIHELLGGMESRMNTMEARMDKLESQVSALRAGQLDMSKDIKKLNNRIEKANQLALVAWGRGVENRKWLQGERKTMYIKRLCLSPTTT